MDYIFQQGILPSFIYEKDLVEPARGLLQRIP